MNKDKGSAADTSNRKLSKSENIDDIIEEEISARRKANQKELGLSIASNKSAQGESNSQDNSLSNIPDDHLSADPSTRTKKKSFLSKAFGKIKDKIGKKNDIGKSSMIVHNPGTVLAETAENDEEPESEIVSDNNTKIQQNSKEEHGKDKKDHSRKDSQADISRFLKRDYFEPTHDPNAKSSSVVSNEGNNDSNEIKPQVPKSTLKRLRRQQSVTTFIPETLQDDDSGFVYDFVFYKDEVPKIKNLRGKIVIQNYLGMTRELKNNYSRNGYYQVR